MKGSDLLSVSQVAQRSGFAPSALRYYEAAPGDLVAGRGPGGGFLPPLLRRPV